MRITATRIATLGALLIFFIVILVISNTDTFNASNDDRLCHSLQYGCKRQFRKDAAPGEKEVTHSIIRQVVEDTHSTDNATTEALEPWEYNLTERGAAIKLQAMAEGMQKADEMQKKIEKNAQKMLEKVANKEPVVQVNYTKTDHKYDRNKKLSYCADVLSGAGTVRSCITKEKIGQTIEDVFFTYKDFEKPTKLEKRETSEDRQHSFKRVFDTHAWGHDWDPNQKGLNASGMGATLPWAQEATATLHMVIDELKQKLGRNKIKILDVPCGDMAWMARFLKTRDDVIYTGIDIVPDLIDNHKKIYRSPSKQSSWTFHHGDILEMDMIDKYDLIFSRTLLQHLYNSDVLKLLHKFSSSGSAYLLTTTWARSKINSELEITEDNPGRFRPLNLELPPVNLSPPLCLQRDGPPDAYQGWDHFLGLWELPLIKSDGCEEPYAIKLPGTDKKVFSCTDWALL